MEKSFIIDRNKRRFLALHDMLEEIESTLHKNIEEDFSLIREKIGEFQKTIDDFQHMEDQISLALLNRDPKD
tara:strand:+ start:8189 stop:8404 length:216 start_codon:yes stop_codon:yes gene_type:complete